MKVLDWSVQLLHSGGAGQVGGVLQVLGEAASVSSMGRGEGWEHIYQEKVPVSFAKLLSWLTNMGDKLEEDEGGMVKLKKGVLSLMMVYNKNKEKEKGSFEEVVEVIIAAVVALLKKKVIAQGEVVLPGGVGELGGISTILVDAIVKQGGSDIFGVAVMNLMKEPEETSIGGMTGAVLLLSSAVKFANREQVMDMVDELVVAEMEKEEMENERIVERELLGEVKAACLEARGRLGLKAP